MKKSERDQGYDDRRHTKLVERQELQKKKVIRDRHFHTVDEDEDEEDHQYDYYLKGK